MADYFLSKEVSYKFLEDVLKIQNPESKQAETPKLDFLTTIIGNWYENVPFQNIDLLCLTKREKRLMTVPEIINYHLQGRGGVCIYNAIFIYLLLKSLDYNVYLTVGSFYEENDHASCIAKDVQEPGDSYLVEVGSGWPCFAPIPLQNLATDLSNAKVYRDSFVTYTYIEEDDLVVRYHREDILRNSNPVRPDGWWKNNWSDLRPVTIDFLFSKKATILKTCVDVTHCGCTRYWFVSLYPKKKGKAVKNNILSWDENGEKKSRYLKDKCEVIESIKSLLPMVEEELISEAIDFVEENIRVYGKKESIDERLI